MIVADMLLTSLPFARAGLWGGPLSIGLTALICVLVMLWRPTIRSNKQEHCERELHIRLTGQEPGADDKPLVDLQFRTLSENAQAVFSSKDPVSLLSQATENTQLRQTNAYLEAELDKCRELLSSDGIDRFIVGLAAMDKEVGGLRTELSTVGETVIGLMGRIGLVVAEAARVVPAAAPVEATPAVLPAAEDTADRSLEDEMTAIINARQLPPLRGICEYQVTCCTPEDQNLRTVVGFVADRVSGPVTYQMCNQCRTALGHRIQTQQVLQPGVTVDIQTAVREEAHVNMDARDEALYKPAAPAASPAA